MHAIHKVINLNCIKPVRNRHKNIILTAVSVGHRRPGVLKDVRVGKHYRPIEIPHRYKTPVRVHIVHLQPLEQQVVCFMMRISCHIHYR